MIPETPNETRNMKPEEVSDDLGVSVDTLRRMRERGDGPPWIEVSERSVRYPSDLYQAWKNSNIKMGGLEK